MAKTHIDAIKRAWISAAKAANMEPAAMSYEVFCQYSPAGSFNFAVRRFGGFAALRERFFGVSPSDFRKGVTVSPAPAPAPKKSTKSKGKKKPVHDDDDFDPGEEPKAPSPLETHEAQELNGEALVDYIADLMGQCAEAIEVEPHELTWLEFAKFINRRWGIDDMKLAKYTIHRAGGFGVIKDRRFPIRPTETTVQKHRSREEANRNRTLGAKFAKEKYFMESIEHFASRVFSGRITVTRPTKLVQTPTRRVLNVLFSDLHIGADIEAEETGYQDFGVVEEARRLAYIVKTIAEYKVDHRHDTELAIILCGDLIQNHLHDPHDGAAVAEQVCRAIHLLTQAIAYLSGHFKKVTVYCTSGNHDRIMSEHHGRAINKKWNGFGTIIAYALSSTLSKLENVSFEIPKTPYVTYTSFGHRTFATHSDTVFNVGRPSKTIKVGEIESQVNCWNCTLKDDEKYAVIACGHVHRLMYQRLDNGSALFTNGPLDPSDAFAVSIGAPNNQAGQWMWETTEEFACGDKRDILVGQKQDKDSSLDHIIQPFRSLSGTKL